MTAAVSPVELFEQCVPLPFIQDSVRLLFETYRQAYEECRPRPWQVAHDLRGHVRRALIEERWPLVAERHQADGIRVAYHPNRKRTSFFTQVTCGRIVLTQSFVEKPETIVRRAEFRNTRARSNQLELFSDNPPPLPDAPLSTLLIHGEARGGRHPYFADIVFPAPDCKSYLARIELFQLCHALVESPVGPPVAEEVIPDMATPELRPQENREA
jgi:hypothetical protein